MALSDACFDFLERVREAAQELGASADWYAAPDYPIHYGEETAALKVACERARSMPWKADDMVQLIRLAAAVMAHYDMPPGLEGEELRRASMLNLVSLFRENLTPADAQEAESIIPEIAKDTPEAARAAGRLSKILGKLGNTAYDIVVKIISDVASETVKKILGIN